MARDLVIRIVGDERQYRRSLDRASKATNGFSRDMDRTFRGVVAGSGAFRSLGRSVAFASTAFLGGVGFTAAIRSSLEAAQDQLKTNKALNAQFRAAGKNVRNYQLRIDEVVNSLVDLGIQDDESIKAFTTLFRATGNVSEALNRMQLVADIAAARQIDLQKAALLVGKVETGNIGILRRYGVAVEKDATVSEALAAATQKFAGQAKAAVTPQARFAAVLDQTQETIGNALLPILTRYLERLTDWLNRMNQSGELQRRVNKLMEDLARILPQVEHGISQVATAVGKVRDAFGGWENALKTLGLLVVLAKLQKFKGKPGGRGGQGGSGLAGITALVLGWPAIAAIGAAAIVNASDKMSDAVNSVYKNVTRANQAIINFLHIPLDLGLDKGTKAALKLADAVDAVGRAVERVGGGAIGAVGAAIATAAGGGRGVGGAGGSPQRREFKLPIPLQLEKARAALTATTKDDVAVAKKIVEMINKLRAAKRLAPKALIAALSELRSALDVIRDATRAQAEKSAETARKHAEAVKRAADKQRQAAEDAARKIKEATDDARSQIGRLFEGPILSPTGAQNRRQLGFPGANLGRMTADVRAQTRVFTQFQQGLARLAKIGAPAELIRQLRERGPDALDQIRAILGGTRGERKALFNAVRAQNIAVQRAAMMQVNARVVNISGSAKDQQTINLIVDGERVSRVVTNRQQKKGRRNAVQRRGRSPNVQTA